MLELRFTGGLLHAEDWTVLLADALEVLSERTSLVAKIREQVANRIADV